MKKMLTCASDENPVDKRMGAVLVIGYALGRGGDKFVEQLSKDFFFQSLKFLSSHLKDTNPQVELPS